MPLERANRIYLHPLHQESYGVLVQLIIELRACREYEHFYAFQQDLLERVLAIQRHRFGCARVASLLQQGKRVPADAPELRSEEDRNNPDTWLLEADVCERVDRQLRSVADAMAWRLFSFDRQAIIALSRNQHPGPMVGKTKEKGLATECAYVTNLWQEEHQFALMHDLTSCLRIGDATSFKDLGDDRYEAYLHEIKTDPNRKVTKQVRRLRLAEEAVRSGGPLPGDPTARLVPLDIPYKTHLHALGDAFNLAIQRGVVGVKVLPARVLVAADFRRVDALWSVKEFNEHINEELVQALKRAQLLNVGHLVHARSDDIVTHLPTTPPWAAYPFSPVTCANLITDMSFYIVMMSSEPLLAALDDADVHAEWVLPRDTGTISGGQVLLRATSRTQTIELLWAEVQQRLLLELVDLEMWAAGVKQLLSRAGVAGRPWPTYADEYKVWK